MDVANEKCEPGLEEFLGEFLEDRSAEVAKLKTLATQGEKTEDELAEEVRKIGHKWKGFSAPYGFQFLIEKAKELSGLAENYQKEKALEVVEQVEDYLIAKKTHLKKEGHV